MADDIEARSVSMTMDEEPSRSVVDTVATEMRIETIQTTAPASDEIMAETTLTTNTINIENHSAEMVDGSAVAAGIVVTGALEVLEEGADVVTEIVGDVDAESAAANGLDDDGDVEMSDHHEYSDEGSEYEPDNETPPPPKSLKTPKKTPGSIKKTELQHYQQLSTPSNNNFMDTVYGAEGSTTATPEHLLDPQTPQGTRPPKTPSSRVRSGRVEKSGGTPGPQGNLRCPVKGCGQTFTGRNPRQSLWHHLKYYATRGLPDRAEFEKSHGEAHAEMKRDAGKIHGTLVSRRVSYFLTRVLSLEPKGTPVERNRISSSDYRKKNPEKAKTSARLSNFRARARKKGLTDEREIEEHVHKWEKEWQEKQAKEASEVSHFTTFRYTALLTHETLVLLWHSAFGLRVIAEKFVNCGVGGNLRNSTSHNDD